MKKLLLTLTTSLLLVGSLTFLIWLTPINNSNSKLYQLYPHPKINFPPSEPCNSHRGNPSKITDLNFLAWGKQDEYQKFRSQLSSTCRGLDRAIITQANTPLGSKLVYDGEKDSNIQVTQDIFNTFAKSNPFLNKTLNTCAVVGNGGILANSSCGKMIDSSQFVIRCNLPPLSNGYDEHVGNKTDLVTANPSILLQKYKALKVDQHKFVENLQIYRNSLLLLPAFSFTASTPVSLQAFHVMKDFKSSIQTVFLNPEYLQDLDHFWGSQGLKASRLSTGMMMVSLALELCAEVHVYGFWPFSFHPHDKHLLPNHYYDDEPAATNFHAMPVEFMLLLQLHSHGNLQLHVGDCKR